MFVRYHQNEKTEWWCMPVNSALEESIKLGQSPSRPVWGKIKITRAKKRLI
jgi:hypothetical protein